MRTLLAIAACMALLVSGGQPARAHGTGAGNTAAPRAAALPGATPDGRRYGHLAYAEASERDLVPAPAGFNRARGCMVHRDMLPDLERLLAKARAELKGVTLEGFSCFRSVAYQAQVFCRGGRRGQCADPLARSRYVAPPGHSEHATGYALDFTQRPSRCPDASACFATTDAGRWLAANAAAFGFEMSFPEGNAQGVTFEPWHWRWVGNREDRSDGATRARTLFLAAHERFPAYPNVLGVTKLDLAGAMASGGNFATLLRSLTSVPERVLTARPRPPLPDPKPLPTRDQPFPLLRLPMSTEWLRPL